MHNLNNINRHRYKVEDFQKSELITDYCIYDGFKTEFIYTFIGDDMFYISVKETKLK